MTKKNILITGLPGTGKTTLIMEIIAEFKLRPWGFYTKEIKEEGKRAGFEINALTPNLRKAKGILARVGLKSPYRVGRYGVNPEDMEEVGAAALEKSLRQAPLIIIDEIGNMEMISRRFQAAVLACLESAVPVLGVIKISGGSFVDRIKSRPDVEIIELSRSNFEEVKRQLREKIKKLTR